jgi:hypothetical protein
MVMLLVVIAGGERRSGELDEVVGVALPQLPSPPTPHTYLRCRPKKSAERGDMVVSKSAVRGALTRVPTTMQLQPSLSN